MDDAKVKQEVGNPIIPKPEVPQKVKDSVTQSKLSVDKTKVGDVTPTKVDVKETPKEELLERGAKGIITIYLFDNAPYQCDFNGKIVGDDINVSWRAMYKEYKLWKHTLSKLKK